jgi:hypothetical protein
MSKDVKSFPLPDINDTYDAANGIPREIFEESSIYPKFAELVSKITLSVYYHVLMHVFFILVSGINSINFTSPTSF